jgi:dolichol-phosphate mannosyltransferase
VTHLRLISTTPEAKTIEAAVVVPTLNEAGNIGALIDGILAADPRLYVVVVDDGSTDGTTEIVEQKAQALTAGGTTRLHLIARGRKLGYASAVQDGMRFALGRGARRVLQMDADFSHDPASLPALLAQSESHELVIGSRYIPGGGTCGWSLKRRLLSRGANALARTLLRLPLHDCTGGFRCWHADLIERCGVLDSAVQGYAFLFLTLDRCRRSGARIGEVPILFAERRSGQSKMNGTIIREAVGVLFRLWLQRLVSPPVSTATVPTLTAPPVTSTEQRRAA